MIHESEVDDKLAINMIQQAKKNLARMGEPERLIEDAARLLGLRYSQDSDRWFNNDGHDFVFNPLDPERGDLIKLAMAAELDLRLDQKLVRWYSQRARAWIVYDFTKGDHDSLCHAILRAASAVYRARGGE